MVGVQLVIHKQDEESPDIVKMTWQQLINLLLIKH